ncbi:septum formation inhibitor Maf [Pukyongia salina]|uniref:Septum formation inhibitor Maf n=1 Tax=Pukyongia salina TaxID=2094025 RepID=A0A2S0HZQ2_9FLAO|nr:septum formation inhibitor Maf [Pukyongia salina]AVI52139.1 septum formation inhibitor Maf [Pukyongia salina]
MTRSTLVVLLPIFAFLFLSGCTRPVKDSGTNENAIGSSEIKKSGKPRVVTKEFKEYWFSGTAEITSYELMQERYGELRKGTAVTVFVSENFLPDVQVKAEQSSKETIPVLKFNSTKKFLTGIYPYSVMTSAFSPIAKKDHAIKISNSVQEWCGQVYMQLNNREKFEFIGHSYFEGEADQKASLDKTWLEDELWNLIRINPEELPTGDITIVPPLEFLRMRHKNISIQNAVASLKQGDSISTYLLKYPELERELIIYFNSSFPFEIEKWEETNSAWGNNQRLTTTATRMKRIKNAYWSRNSNADVALRDSLGLNP